MTDVPSGEMIRGFLASSDISAGVTVPLFDRNGVSRALVAGERLILTDVFVSNGATASIITLYQDNNGDAAVDAGEALFAGSYGINGSSTVDLNIFINLAPQVATLTNGLLKVRASTSSVGTRIFVSGIITKS